jgi:hypothetical protein
MWSNLPVSLLAAEKKVHFPPFLATGMPNINIGSAVRSLPEEMLRPIVCDVVMAGEIAILDPERYKLILSKNKKK